MDVDGNANGWVEVTKENGRVVTKRIGFEAEGGDRWKANGGLIETKRDGKRLPSDRADRLYGWNSYQRLLHEVVVEGGMALVMVGEWDYDVGFYKDEFEDSQGNRYCGYTAGSGAGDAPF